MWFTIALILFSGGCIAIFIITSLVSEQNIIASVSSPHDRLTWSLRKIARFFSSTIAMLILSIYLGVFFDDLFSGELIQDWTQAWTQATIFVVFIAFGSIISWWREGIGGTILVGVVLLMFLTELMEGQAFIFLLPMMIIFGLPLILSGVLFIICWQRSKKPKKMLN